MKAMKTVATILINNISMYFRSRLTRKAKTRSNMTDSAALERFLDISSRMKPVLSTDSITSWPGGILLFILSTTSFTSSATLILLTFLPALITIVIVLRPLMR